MADEFQNTPPAFDVDEDPAADFLAREQTELADIDGNGVSESATNQGGEGTATTN